MKVWNVNLRSKGVTFQVPVVGFPGVYQEWAASVRFFFVESVRDIHFSKDCRDDGSGVHQVFFGKEVPYSNIKKTPTLLVIFKASCCFRKNP